MNTNEKIATYIMGEPRPTKIPTNLDVWVVEYSAGKNWFWFEDWEGPEPLRCEVVQFNLNSTDSYRLLEQLLELGDLRMHVGYQHIVEIMYDDGIVTEATGQTLMEAVYNLAVRLIAKKGL